MILVCIFVIIQAINRWILWMGQRIHNVLGHFINLIGLIILLFDFDDNSKYRFLKLGDLKSGDVFECFLDCLFSKMDITDVEL